MRVLFVSGIDGFCHRYQVLHRAAQMSALGASTTIRHFADPRLHDELAAHDLLVAYRVPETAATRALLAVAGDLGIPRLGAIDDLIFVDDPRCLPDLERLTRDERDAWRDGVRRYRATLARCDAFVAPTEPLVRIADGLGWRAHLHRNATAPAELELGRRARERAAAAQRPGPVLGYFSGTPSHDDDFASIGRALRDVLAAVPDARLRIVGPLRLPEELAALGARIERCELVPWDELPDVIASTDVCLAPLLAERPFAAAKGEIKYLEAGAVGVPTVATATAAYRHAIHDGENGMLATTQDEWRRALGALLGDQSLRRRLGAAAFADVARRYGEAARARELLAIVEDLRGGLRRRGRGAIVARPAFGDAHDEPPARRALEADGRPAFPAGAAVAVTPPLGGGSVLIQRVRCAHDGLMRVDLHAVTYGQRLARRLSLTLRRDDGRVVAHDELAAAELPDRGFVALELDAPEADSAGRVYELEIRAHGARGGSAPSFGTAALAPAGTSGALEAARLDGGALDAALALRGFAAWESALHGRASVAADAARSAHARRTAPALGEAGGAAVA